MGQRNCILVVDDDATIVAMMTERLRHAGYVVSEAADGPAAVIQAEALKPKLIIADIQMPPWSSGVEALAEIRKARGMKDVPVIFLTGMPPDEARKLVPPDPRVCLMSKPVDWIMLEQAIEQLIGETKTL